MFSENICPSFMFVQEWSWEFTLIMEQSDWGWVWVWGSVRALSWKQAPDLSSSSWNVALMLELQGLPCDHELTRNKSQPKKSRMETDGTQCLP